LVSIGEEEMKLLATSLIVALIVLADSQAANAKETTPREQTSSPKYAFLVSNISAEEVWCITAPEKDYDFASLRFQPCRFDEKPKNQLWSFDESGKIHSALDYDKCMIVDHGTDIFDGVRIKLARCGLHTSLNRFTHSGDSSKLKVFVNDAYCITNHGSKASAGDTIHAKPCQEQLAHVFTYRQ
jgi:hypothetical protein